MLNKFRRSFYPRYWSNDELRSLAPHLPTGARIINVSGWQDEDKEGGVYREYFPTPSVYHISNYRGDRARGVDVRTDLMLDLGETLPVEHEGQYDIAFNHTVLEHVADPSFAFKQIGRLTSDLIVTVVPFKQKLHFEPGMFGDYYRFTPFSMRLLHEQNGFTVVYESYTPRPSLDTYLFYVGARDPRRHPNFPQRLVDINSLNQRMGNFSARDLWANIIARFVTKYAT